jgi:hypothetical protein
MKWKLAVGAIVVVVVGMGIGVMTGRLPASRSGGTPAASSSPSTRPGDGGRPASTSPLPTGPFDAVRDQLEQRASAGDAAAAYRLGRVIAGCRRYVEIDNGAFAGMLLRAAGTLGGLLNGGSGDDERLVMDALIEQKAFMDDLCAGTGAMRRSATAADAQRWLALAAERGDVQAMALYGDAAFEEYPAAADLLDHADEVARRRDRARGWLASAYGKGEPEALFGYAKAYMRGDLFPQDDERALGWWLGYRRSTTQGSFGPAAAAAFERRLRNAVDAPTAARAEAFGRRVALGISGSVP